MMPLLGNVAENKKNSYGFTKIHLGVHPEKHSGATCARELRIDLALIPLLGNVAENKNFPTVSPRSIYEFI